MPNNALQSTKAIRDVQMVSLGEAKRVFSEATAWSQEVRNADTLHVELIALIEKERSS